MYIKVALLLILLTACNTVLTSQIKNKPNLPELKPTMQHLTPVKFNINNTGKQPLYCLDGTNYKSLALNTEKTIVYIQEQNNIIETYKKYYTDDLQK